MWQRGSRPVGVVSGSQCFQSESQLLAAVSVSKEADMAHAKLLGCKVVFELTWNLKGWSI